MSKGLHLVCRKLHDLLHERSHSPTCKLFPVGISCITLYPFSLGKFNVPCEASTPFLEMVSTSFCDASHLQRDSDFRALMSAVFPNRFQEPEPEDWHVICSFRPK